MKRKAILLVASHLKEKVFGGGRLERLTELVDLIDASASMDDRLRLYPLIADCEIAISTWGMPKLDADFLRAAPMLRAVFYAAGSVKPFMTDEAWDKGIVVQSSWGANAVAVSEFVVAQIVLGLKNYYAQVRASRETRMFKRLPVNGCLDKRVGIIGAGMTGQATIKRLKSYDLKVVVCDPYLSDDAAEQFGVETASLDELFELCHVVSVQAPSLPQTRHMVKSHHIKTMPENGCFINTSRGTLVDEAGLVEALRARPDLTAIIDVTDPEPPTGDSELWDVPNLLISPHIAGPMDDECWRMADFAIDELRRYLAGEYMQYQVTREMLARMA